jgi:hypothetical protein
MNRDAVFSNTYPGKLMRHCERLISQGHYQTARAAAAMSSIKNITLMELYEAWTS